MASTVLSRLPTPGDTCEAGQTVTGCGLLGTRCGHRHPPPHPTPPTPQSGCLPSLPSRARRAGGDAPRDGRVAQETPWNSSSVFRTETKSAFPAAGPETPGCYCLGAAPEALQHVERTETRVRAGAGERPRNAPLRPACSGTAVRPTRPLREGGPADKLSQRHASLRPEGPGSSGQQDRQRQTRRHPHPRADPGARALYLVPAHQEEVHRRPVEAVSFTEPSQDLLDGQPRLDRHHAGRPVGELDAAVPGRLVPLWHRGPAGLRLGSREMNVTMGAQAPREAPPPAPRPPPTGPHQGADQVGGAAKYRARRQLSLVLPGL